MTWKPGKAMKNPNDAFSVPSWMHRGVVIVAFVAILLGASAIQGEAQTYTISVSDSSIQVNTTSGLLSDWIVGGQDQLAGQSFYYSLGGDAYSIGTISSPSSPVFTGEAVDGFVLETNVAVTYENSQLKLTTGYTLSLQGPGAGLTTTITIQNVSSGNETLQLYQLSNFTLGGMSGGQTVQFLQTTNYSVMQTGGGYVLNGSLSGVGLGTAIPVGEQAGNNDLGLSSGSAAPNFNGDSPLSASGTVYYGYELSETLTPGSSLSMSELQTVPEPSSVALVFSGLIGLGFLRRNGLAMFKK